MNETSEPDRPRKPDIDTADVQEPATADTSDVQEPVTAGSSSDIPPAESRKEPADAPPPTEPAEAGEAVDTPPRRAGGRGVAILALLLALIAIAGAGYVGWLQRLAAVGADGERADLVGEISGIRNDSATLRDDVQRLTREVEQVRERGAGVDGEIARLDRRIGDAELAVARVGSDERTPTEQQWVQKELEHLLRIANHQLSLARDADTALAALVAADELIASAGDPALLPIRRQLADDMLALRSMERPDVEGLALRLASLARRVDDLRLSGQPMLLADEGASVSADDSGFARLRRKIAEFLRGIFRVRRSSGDAGPLLSPEQSFFLRRNLELELQSARVALLADDAPVYRTSIGAARRWAEQYFDTDDPGVKGFVDALQDLENRRISADHPDISGSLRVLLDTSRATPAPQ